MIAATVALPVRGPDGAYRVSRSATSVEAAEATVSPPSAAQPAPAATVAATMPPLGSGWLACIMGLLGGRGRGWWPGVGPAGGSPHGDGALHHLQVVLAVEPVGPGF